MRGKHHRLCTWFRPSLPHREQLHEKKTSSSLHVTDTNPRLTGSSYVRRKHHRLCMWFRPNPSHWEQLHEKTTASSLYMVQPKHVSLEAAAWEVNIIVFVCGLDQTHLTGSSYMRRQHHRLCIWFSPSPPHWEQLHEKLISSSLYVVQTKSASPGAVT